MTNIQVGRNWSATIIAGAIIGILLIMIMLYVFRKRALIETLSTPTHKTKGASPMRRILIAFVFADHSTCQRPAAQVASQQSASTLIQTAGNPSVKVWVNTAWVYITARHALVWQHKTGEYITQKQAQEKGNRPAYEFWWCQQSLQYGAK